MARLRRNYNSRTIVDIRRRWRYCSAMDLETAAKCLAELGNPTRLAAYQLLVKAGPTGLSVGEIQDQLQIPKSTLSHHIAHLLWAGLITQVRDGRTQRCAAVYETMDALMAFLSKECCSGVRSSARRQRAGK